MFRREAFIAVIALTIGGALLPVTGALSAEEALSAEKENRKVLYFTRNVGYEHSVVHREGDELSHSEKALTALCAKAGIDVTCTKDGRVFDGDIDQYDAFAFYTNNDLTKPNQRKVPPMSSEGKQKLLAAISAGKGFVGFHSTCASWRTPQARGADQAVKLDPFLAMLGGEFTGHGAQQKATMRVVSRTFPGVEKIGGAFTMHEEWYAIKNFADDLHVILVQETDRMQGGLYQRPPYPATWARREGKGRVFYTSMGHREDVWTHEMFQKIVLNGIVWAVGDADAEVTPNMKHVTPDAVRR